MPLLAAFSQQWLRDQVCRKRATPIARYQWNPHTVLLKNFTHDEFAGACA